MVPDGQALVTGVVAATAFNLEAGASRPFWQVELSSVRWFEMILVPSLPPTAAGTVPYLKSGDTRSWQT